MAKWRRIAEFLALRRNTSLLLIALVLAGTGERLWLGFTPKYLLELGAAPFVVGLFDALQTFLGAVYAWPGGWLTDRWGQRRSLMLFSILSLAGYLLLLVWHHWLAVIFGAFLFLAWTALSLPTTFAVVATSIEAARHTMGIGVQSMVRRVPMLIGPLAGGWLISRFGWIQGVQYSLLACIGLNLVTMGFQWFILEGEVRPRSRTKNQRIEDEDEDKNTSNQGASAGFGETVKSFTPTLRELLVSDILIRFCERLPFAWVLVWATDFVGVSAKTFGVLVSFEMIAAMLCYIPVAHLADRYGRRPFVLITFGFFTLFPITLLWATTFGWLAFAFVVRGLKEFGEPARKALIVGEGTPELRARTYGAYYLIRDCVVTSGSFLGAWLWKLGPRANFLGAAVCGALGTIWYWWFVFRRKGSVRGAF